LVPYLVTPALPAGHLNRLAQPSLSLDGLVLRPWRVADAPIVKAAFDCPEIQRWHTLRMDSDGEALGWIADWEKRWRDEEAASWAISSPDDVLLGQIGLRRISLFEADAGLSYWVLPSSRGKGIAAQAVQALTGWAFDSLGLNRLRLMHSVANQASCRVAAKASFGLEGTLLRCMRHTDGWHDMHLHARLKP
jgi:RimJ/RimL family protein N-acetyltransferase